MKVLRLMLLVLPLLWVSESLYAHGEDERIDFSLTTDQGAWSLSSLRGKVVFLFFGYTHCPDICPTSLQILGEAFDQLSEAELQRARGVFVSLDPARDTPERLREYAAYFHPNIIGVTGSKAEVKAAADQMGVSYRLRQQGDSYSVDHSTLTFALKPDGTKLMVLVSHVAPPDYVAQLVRDTLKESGDAKEAGQ